MLLKVIATVLCLSLMAFQPTGLVALGIDPFAGLAESVVYTITVQTDSPAYGANQTIVINGTVSPTPSTPSNVTITIKGPGSVVVLNGSAAVGTLSGSYSYTLTADSDCKWLAGSYQVAAVWQGSGQAAKASTTFQWSPPLAGRAAPCTTTSSTSTVPEFPIESLAIVLFATMLVLMLVSRKSSIRMNH